MVKGEFVFSIEVQDDEWYEGFYVGSIHLAGQELWKTDKEYDTKEEAYEDAVEHLTNLFTLLFSASQQPKLAVILN